MQSRDVAHLKSGTVEYSVFGPRSSEHPPIVFVHGVVVDQSLWREVAVDLAGRGYRSFTPTWPLGSHRIAWSGASRGPRGVAELVAEFIEDFDLRGCTLVGNDTGGAICQFLLADRPELVGRVVLTNCDAFEKFPPPQIGLMFAAFRTKALQRPLSMAVQSRRVRHSPLAFGMLAGRLDSAVTASWARSVHRFSWARADLRNFLSAVDKHELARVSPTMRQFPGPVTLVWGGADRFFTTKLGRRLAAAFGDDRPGGTRFAVVDGARTFVPLDRPDAVADEIVAITSIDVNGRNLSGHPRTMG